MTAWWFIFGIVIGLIIGQFISIIIMPYAGKLFVDKRIKQGFIGFSNLDLDKLHTGGAVRLTVKEIDIRDGDVLQKNLTL